MKHLMTLTLGGLVGVCLMASDASACHKNKCVQTTCYQPVVQSNCAPAPKVKKRCGLCHKKVKRCACGTPVMACGYGSAYAPMASGQHMMATPQASGQYMMTPHAPGKSMGSVQH